MDSHHSILKWLFFLFALIPAVLLAQTPETVDPSTKTDADQSTLSLQPGAIEQLTDKIKPSLVTVRQIGRDGDHRGLGAGFVIDESGLIATNFHVIGEGRSVVVELSSGETFDVTEVYLSDPYFDLAVVRIQPGDKKLSALKLGDSERLRQGQIVAGFGAPLGLKFSVVTGVISAIRKLEKQFLGDETPEYPMIQLAMPIEQGNSGGPVVNLEGEVVGITTLKHRLKENLGFAVRSNDLGKLLEKPNPIAMNRWKTIGSLDPRRWTVQMDGDWSQRSGVISAKRPGSGFGGRTICLSQIKPPEDKYEISVRVRLDDESGAAGLAFSADGADRHFGFYPTGGKLRLTRFDGPDVYSWNILSQIESDSYHPGQWNHLRVRIEGETVTCFVNGEKVVSLQAPGLVAGKAGLCKFRDTDADFRDFRIGDNLADDVLSAEQLSGMNEAVAQHLSRGPSDNTDDLMSQLSPYDSLGIRYLENRAEEYESLAQKMRTLKIQLHQRTVAVGLKTALDKKDEGVDLFEVALQLARIDDPELDDSHYREVFQTLVRDAADYIGELTEKDAVLKLRDFLFKENGFHGSRNEYYHPANSYINHVLDDREGLPITLSVLFIEMARRLKIHHVYGVPLPGQFLVGFRENPSTDPLLINVFEQGKTMNRTDAEALAISFGSVTSDETFEPYSPRSIAVRMLRNLIDLEMNQQKNPPGALGYLDLLLEVDSENSAARFQRALVRVQVKDIAGAKKDLDWLLEKRPSGINYSRMQQFRDSLP